MTFHYMNAIELEIDEIKNVTDKCFGPLYEKDVYKKTYKTTLICKLKNKIIGYAMLINLKVDHDELLPYSFKYFNEAVYKNLFSLAVLPEYRNKGIAQKMLKIIHRQNKKKPIILYSRISNEIALHIYEKIGFVIIKTIHKYYKDPEEDAYLIMLK